MGLTSPDVTARAKLASPSKRAKARKPEHSLAIQEIIEVGMRAGSRHVLARHADKRAGEICCAGHLGFVRQDGGVENLGQALPLVRTDAISESQPLLVHFHAQFDGAVRK